MLHQKPKSLMHCLAEEGRNMTFMRHSSLEQHLDCGKHKFALERETIFDKATLGYAEKLEGQFIGIPHLHVRQQNDSTKQRRNLANGMGRKIFTRM